MGGTLAYYASKGADVYLVCATRGEVGDVAPEMLKGFGSIAELREIRIALRRRRALGLAGVYFLDYRDSGMTGSPDNTPPAGTGRPAIGSGNSQGGPFYPPTRPEVVLTFDPIGGYRHPDHVAIHNATVRAFEMAGDPTFAPGDLKPFKPGQLYFHVFPKKALQVAVKLMPLIGKNPHKFGANGDIDMTTIAICGISGACPGEYFVR